jgi:hypothetical protein
VYQFIWTLILTDCNANKVYEEKHRIPICFEFTRKGVKVVQIYIKVVKRTVEGKAVK